MDDALAAPERGDIPTVNLPNWNQLIFERFFSKENSGRPIYLLVDEEALREVGAAAALPQDDAVGDFLNAVRQTVQRTGDPFLLFKMPYYTWKAHNRIDPPPFIGLLAASVLAASRMTHDPEKAIQSSNYYFHLNEVLGLPGRATPEGIEFVVECWKQLNDWLFPYRKGELGLPTARTQGRLTRIGYALSQCLLREVDRARLSDFFEWKGLSPGATLSAAEIVEDFFEWVSRSSCSLTKRTREALLRCPPEARALAAEIVSGELSDWDGSSHGSAAHGSAGYPRAARDQRIAPLWLEAREVVPGRRFALHFVARRPDGFPTGSFTLSPAVPNSPLDVELVEAWPGFYEPIEIPVTEKILVDGFTLTRGGYRLHFAGSLLHILGVDEDISSDFVSKARVSLGQSYVLFTPVRIWSQIRGLVADEAKPGWRETTDGALPAGWTLVSGVVIEKAFSKTALDRLGPDIRDAADALRPALKIEVRLIAGLKFRPGCWMTLAPPILEVQAIRKQDIIVEVDGRDVYRGPTPIRFDLSTLNLTDGPHSVIVLDRERRFELLSTLQPDGVVTAPIGWSAGIDGRFNWDSLKFGPGETGLEGGYFVGGSAPRTVTTRGLVFKDGIDDSYSWLGANFGDLQDVRRRVLHGQVDGVEWIFERPPFEVAWLVWRHEGSTELIPANHPPRAPQFGGTLLSGKALTALKKWAGLVLTSRFLRAACSTNCKDQCFATYQEYGTRSEELHP